ncbi:AAA domain-containing protein [Kushneria sinocarnis]|uniref:AAA domain-containing protein n=1 Tax=Kushneria sinocarnis TaxID=595502 RepID=A0A420WUH5_9GAMM|nr:AAA family ATPase [Kushneria sinocarnis]RKQ97109.1 AAA domain-containing protein [Kushneria sinocarnis]
MSIATLVLGQSGTGKTASLRNLEPSKTALIKAVEKPLPFRSKDWQQVTTDQWGKMVKAAQTAAHRGREVVVVDDFQYVMANEFMRRSEEKGFDKFTEIARHAWEVINALSSLPEHVRVYILSHTQDDDFGRTKIKTIGKMLDEKITLEGLFTIVLRTQVNDGVYQFRTVNNGSDTVKSPMGLFESDLIENDINAVDSQIVDYYGITQPEQQEQVS